MAEGRPEASPSGPITPCSPEVDHPVARHRCASHVFDALPSWVYPGIAGGRPTEPMTSANHMTTLLLSVGATVLFAPTSAAEEPPENTTVDQDATYREDLASPRHPKSRYRLELELHAGGAFPGEDDGLRPGPTVGAALLYRPSADWAIGAVYDHYWFDWHAEAREFDDPAGSAAMQVFGVANRLYMLETSRFEPYIQVMLGWARMTSSAKSEQCDDADGLYPELSVGFDVYAAPWFRLTPSVFVTSGPLRFGGCDDMYIPNDPPPEPSTGLMAGLRFGGTFVFGDRRRP